MDPLIDAVLAGATGDLDADAATVLVAANSDVSNTQTGDRPQTRYFRLRLDLVREGERWLISNVQS